MTKDSIIIKQQLAMVILAVSHDGTIDIIKNRFGERKDNISVIEVLQVLEKSSVGETKNLLNALISKLEKIKCFL